MIVVLEKESTSNILFTACSRLFTILCYLQVNGLLYYIYNLEKGRCLISQTNEYAHKTKNAQYRKKKRKMLTQKIE